MNRSPDSSMSPDRLVVARFNRDAVEAAREYSRAFPDLPSGPLVIRGAAGMGKTHILRALVVDCERERPGLDVTMTAVGDFVHAWETGEGESFPVRWRNADIVLLDDAHLLSGRDAAAAAVVQTVQENPEVGWVIAVREDQPLEGIWGEWLAAASSVRIGVASPGTLDRVLREEADVNGLPIDDDRINDWVQAAEGNVAHALHLLHTECGARIPPEIEQPQAAGEFDSFLSDITSTVADIVDSAPWRARLGEAILKWEGEGFRTGEIEDSLDTEDGEEALRRLERFEERATRLIELQRQIAQIDPEAADRIMFRDPARVPDAEKLLSELKEEASERASAAAAEDTDADEVSDRWLRQSERVCWSHLSLDDRIIEELG